MVENHLSVGSMLRLSADFRQNVGFSQPCRSNGSSKYQLHNFTLPPGRVGALATGREKRVCVAKLLDG